MLKSKKGIIFGIANDHSIAWGIAKKLAEKGAEIGITYQNDTLLKTVKPLAEKININLPGTKLNHELYLKAIDAGLGELDHSALYKVINKN